MRALFFLWVTHGFAAFNLTWGIPAVNLNGNPPVGDADGNATIAMDPMGNAVATWSRTIGTGASEDVWAAVYSHALRVWTGPLKVSGDGSAAHPRVTIDWAGNALLVWDEGFPSQIRSRALTAQGVWIPDLSMPPTHVQPSKHAQTFPQIGIDASGNALLIWMEYRGGIDHIHSAKKPSGLSWVGLGAISSGRNDTTLIASKGIAVNHGGSAIAVWQESTGAFSEIHGARYTAGAWSSPFAISDEEGQIAHFPAAGIDAAGNAVIVWNQGNVIQSKTIIDGVLSADPLLASNPAYVAKHPDIKIDPMGNAVLVFERSNSMHKFITGTTLPFRASSWSTSVDISEPSPSISPIAGYPVLSTNEIGDGVVIWKEDTGTHVVIQGAGYSLGTWSPITTLSSRNDNSGAFIPSYDTAVSVNLAGNVVAIWPEDPAGSGSFQIKATAGVGLANAGPLPPLVEPTTVLNGIVSGFQSLRRFPAHADLYNTIIWESPGHVAYYKIYRNNFSTLIGTSTETRYEDHQRTPKKRETYLITSVDHNGQESGPMTVVVFPR